MLLNFLWDNLLALVDAGVGEAVGKSYVMNYVTIEHEVADKALHGLTKGKINGLRS